MRVARSEFRPYIFSDDELERIFKSADNIEQKDSKADPYLAIEFPVILRLLYSCGLRIGETLQIQMSDIDFDNGVLRMLKTKGNKQRMVPMSESMTDIIIKYCMSMGLYHKKEGWLFPSSKSEGPLSHAAVKRRFGTILENNGIHLENRKKYERGPCLHCMRHVFAFKSFSQAESEGRHLDDVIPFLSLYLGHESLDETSKYLKFSSELFPESVDTFGDFMKDLLPEVDYDA